MSNNPLKLIDIEFVEFTAPHTKALHHLFLEFGFSLIHTHGTKKIDHYKQNQINFLLNHEPKSFAEHFAKTHGPSICSMGWIFEDAEFAFNEALKRGALPAETSDYKKKPLNSVPAIYGIGGSLIYFIDKKNSANVYEELGFRKSLHPIYSNPKGFTRIDHLTNNVLLGTMKKWGDFYKEIFGFTEVRYFDIRGVKTGLQSYALKAPSGTFCIPINEASEEKSQINEYLREYHGPGIQHLAFLTDDIVASLEGLKGSSIKTLDIDDEYYEEVFQRVPHVSEDKKTLKENKILVDGDEEGYLLQIFTKNIIGPIFIEIIQRKNHHSFGEGNFKALFRSIEKDQEERGVFAT